MNPKFDKASRALSISAICGASFLPFSFCNAQQLPLWEVGLGVAAISLPDYRGSDEDRGYVLPAPYFVYRGEFLKADRNGIRTMLFDTERVEANLSANATLPVNSKDNVARRGMPDLKPTVELGGNISVTLWKSAGHDMKLDFRAPVRTAITVESSPRQIGWLFAPNLNLDVKDPAGFSGWNLGLQAGPVYNNREYNAHFYSVSPTYATAARPAYSARGGYSGAQFTTALSKRFPRYWIGGFLRYDTVAGAVFEDSPLVTRRSNILAGAAISWIFGESSQRVNAEE